MVDSKAVAAQGTAQAAALRAAIAAFDELPQFQYIQQLGKGTFGVVALAKHVSRGDLVAIKLVPRAHVNPNVDNREIAILRSLRHHHVIRFKEMHLTTRFVAIVMEYASGGDLLTLVSSRGPLAEPDARWFFQQLIIALDYCHREGVVNRDIKLENTLLQPQQNHPNRPFLKLCDFGLAKAAFMSAPHSRVGTEKYMAPEVIHNPMGEAYSGQQADVWSCGVMLYVMLFGDYPFKGADRELRQNILNAVWGQSVDVPPGAAVTPDCRDLLSRIFVTAPQQRTTVQGIINHPWFLRDLPTSALTMNDEIIAENHKQTALHVLQTTQQLEEILRQAAMPAHSTHDQYDFDNCVDEDLF